MNGLRNTRAEIENINNIIKELKTSLGEGYTVGKHRWKAHYVITEKATGMVVGLQVYSKHIAVFMDTLGIGLYSEVDYRAKESLEFKSRIKFKRTATPEEVIGDKDSGIKGIFAMVKATADVLLEDHLAKKNHKKAIEDRILSIFGNPVKKSSWSNDYRIISGVSVRLQGDEKRDVCDIRLTNVPVDILEQVTNVLIEELRYAAANGEGVQKEKDSEG
jgi:hypothetical protein